MTTLELYDRIKQGWTRSKIAEFYGLKPHNVSVLIANMDIKNPNKIECPENKVKHIKVRYTSDKIILTIKSKL